MFESCRQQDRKSTLYLSGRNYMHMCMLSFLHLASQHDNSYPTDLRCGWNGWTAAIRFTADHGAIRAAMVAALLTAERSAMVKRPRRGAWRGARPLPPVPPRQAWAQAQRRCGAAGL